MSRRVVVTLLVWAGYVSCGRLAYDLESRLASDAASSDGADDEAGSADAASDGPALDGSPSDGSTIDSSLALPIMPFGEPRLISALTSPAEDDDPSVTADLLELYFESSRDQPNRLYVSRRDSPSDPWGPPSVVVELQHLAMTNPHVTFDGLSLYLTPIEWGPVGRQDIHVSRRMTRMSSWSAPVVVSELSSTEHDSGGSESPTGLVFVLDSDRSGATGLGDIWLAHRGASQDVWRTPERLDILNSTMDEANPTLAVGDRLIVFDSDRLEGDDLYFSTRASVDAAFDAPEPFDELNSPDREVAPGLSPDGCYIVFASTRGGDAEIYEASR